MKLEKTKNATRNIAWGSISKITNMLLQFILRTVIIKKLGADYLGLNSLFTSILQILNLTELGFSNAILYSLYKPLANDDYNLVGLLLNFYRKIYHLVGIVIIVVGITIMPFLNKFIEGDCPTDISIYTVYIIYLLNTALSYFLFAYKKTLLTAVQREDLNNRANFIVSILFYLLQIILIIVFSDYYMFLIVVPLFTVTENLLCNWMAKKYYPQYICINGTLGYEYKKDIVSRVGAIFVLRLSQMTRNSFDSIFVSAYLGLTMVTVYNNYYYILSSAAAVMTILTNSIRAAVGNSVVSKTENENYKEMKNISFCYMWISGWFTVCIAALTQPFMKIWVGDGLILSDMNALLFAIYFYVLRIGEVRSLYIEAVGLWKESRPRAVLEMFVNIILNWTLVQGLGITGILIATIVSVFFISQIYGTWILYKNYFRSEKFSDFITENLMFIIATSLTMFAVLGLCQMMSLDNVLFEFLIRGIICIIMPNLIFILLFGKTEKYSFMVNLFRKIMSK